MEFYNFFCISVACFRFLSRGFFLFKISSPLYDHTQKTFRICYSVVVFKLCFFGSGYLEYATQDSLGNLSLSGIRAHNEADRSNDDRAFLRSLSKDLRYNTLQIKDLQKARGLREDLLQKTSGASSDNYIRRKARSAHFG